MKFQHTYAGIGIAAIATLMVAGMGTAGAAPGVSPPGAEALSQAQTIPNTAQSNHAAPGILLAQRNRGGFRGSGGMRRGRTMRPAPRAQGPRRAWRWQSGRPVIGSHRVYRNRRPGYRHYNG